MSSRMAYFGGSPEEKEKWKETILQKLSYLPNDGSVCEITLERRSFVDKDGDYSPVKVCSSYWWIPDLSLCDTLIKLSSDQLVAAIVVSPSFSFTRKKKRLKDARAKNLPIVGFFFFISRQN